MPIHTTMIVATMKNVSWLTNQLSPCRSSAQLTRPYSVSNIHCQTIVAVSAGIAQATISEAETNSRIALPSASSSRAMSTPSTIVRTTLTKQKSERAPQDGPEVGLVEDGAEVVEADPRRRLPEHLRQAVLLQRHRHEPDERVAEHHHEHDDRREQEDVGQRR